MTRRRGLGLHGGGTCALPFLEVIIPLWSISGFRRKAAWTFAALSRISLAFGMSVAGELDTASNNNTYVLVCCAGLLPSPSET